MSANLDQLLAGLKASGNFTPPATPQSSPVQQTQGQNWAQNFLQSQQPSTTTPLPSPGLTTLGGGTTATSQNGTGGVPLWQKALAVLNVPHAIVANTINDVVQNNPTKGWKGAAEDLVGYNPLVNSMLLGAPAAITTALDPNSVQAVTHMHPLQDIGNALTLNPNKQTGTNDILNNLGWQTPSTDPLWERALHGAASFAGDVATDPLSYVTFGAGGAAKSGVEAAAEQAAKVAGQDAVKAAGNDVGKMAENAGQKVFNDTMAANQHVNPDLAQKLAAQKAQEATASVLNAAKAGRAGASKAAMSVDIPFTNVHIPLFNRPQFMQPFEKTLGQLGRADSAGQRINDVFDKLGVPIENRSQELANRYGVSSAKDMTQQMFDHFNQTVGKLEPPGAVRKLPTETNVQSTLTPYTESLTNLQPIDRLGSPVANPLKMPTGALSKPNQDLQWLYDVAHAQGVPAGQESEFLHELMNYHGGDLNKTLQNLDKVFQEKNAILPNVVNRVKGASQLGYRAVDKLPETVIPGNRMLEPGMQETTQEIPRELYGQTADVLPFNPNAEGQFQKVTQSTLDKTAPFTADMGGHTALGHKLADMFSALNPRAGAGANIVRDAQNAYQSRLFDLTRNPELKQYENLLTQLSPEEQKMLPFLREGELPQFMTPEEKSALSSLNGENAGVRDQVLPLMDKLFGNAAQNEVAAGSLKPEDLLNNYYYHMLNKDMSPEELQQFLDDHPNIKRFAGSSQKNGSAIQRGVFKNLAQWRNAIDVLESEGKTADAEALRNLYETDPQKVMQKRLQNSVKNTTFSQMFSDLKDQGLYRNAADHPPASERSNFAHLVPGEKNNDQIARALGIQPNSYVHKDVLSGLDKINKLFESDKMNKLFDNINSVTNIWKAFPIIYNPAHLKTREVGNVMNAMLGGAKVGDFKEAAQLQRAAMKQTVDKPLTAEEQKMWKLAVDHGIVSSHSGQTADMFLNQGNALERLNKLTYNNKAGKAMGNTLNAMDNNARLALFIRSYKTYGDATKAAMNVKKYLFNYNELTTAEKGIRTVVPFYTWVRNNLPLMASEFARNPRYFLTTNQAIQTTHGQHPTYPWAQDFMGTGIGNTFEDLRLPAEDLSNWVNTPRAQLLNAVNPGLITLPETYTNQNWFSQMPIDKLALPGTPAGMGPSMKFALGQMLAGSPTKIAGQVAGNGKSLGMNVANDLIGGFSNQNPASIAKENAWAARETKTLKKAQRKAQAKAKG